MFNEATAMLSVKAQIWAAGCGLSNTDCDAGVTAFFKTGAGKMLQGFLGIIGILVVLVAMAKVVGKVSQGKIGEAVKIALGAAVLASILIQPMLVQDILSAFGSVAKSVISSFSDVANKTGGA